MENSDSIWQWCKARKKLFTMSKIQSMADGFSSVAKIGSLADGSLQTLFAREINASRILPSADLPQLLKEIH
jgi:hypothetical protein